MALVLPFLLFVFSDTNLMTAGIFLSSLLGIIAALDVRGSGPSLPVAPKRWCSIFIASALVRLVNFALQVARGKTITRDAGRLVSWP